MTYTPAHWEEWILVEQWWGGARGRALATEDTLTRIRVREVWRRHVGIRE